ncbi:hypothetical protein ACSW9V_14935 (plasmid) [Clostridium perfringens]|uniref:hypothetical protein n=1 Tax=Clostridium perfringens TaxID=1502 RepID=UPI001CCB7CF5|nr:hypothetical protein [Clostridium perfringens]UBK51358.1 hypothetical protein KLF52_15655 [Clostridium perfringens]
MRGILAEELVLKNIERVNKLKDKYSTILNINTNDIDIDVVIENGEELCNLNQNLNKKQLEIFNSMNEKLKDSSTSVIVLKKIKYKDFYGECEEKRVVFFIKGKETNFIVKNIL